MQTYAQGNPISLARKNICVSGRLINHWWYFWRTLAIAQACCQTSSDVSSTLTSAPILQTLNFIGHFTFSVMPAPLVLVQSYINRMMMYWNIWFRLCHRSSQCNYNITELECLAAVLSIKKFRAYIEGFQFTIITDHAALKWLMYQKNLSSRLARWSLKLQAFKFYIP